MTIREFVDAYNIQVKDFAEACELNYSTFWTYVTRNRTPCLRASIKIILQSGGLITMEDLLRKDEPLEWTPRKRILRRNRDYVKKSVINNHVRKAHYRKAYVKVIDSL